MPLRAASKPPSEATVRDKIREHIYHLFPGAYWESNPPSPWGESGRPDMEICAQRITTGGFSRDGVYVGLELKAAKYAKRPWKQLSDEQQKKLEWIAQANGLALLTGNLPFQRDGLWNLHVWRLMLDRNNNPAGWYSAIITGHLTGATHIEFQEN